MLFCIGRQNPRKLLFLLKFSNIEPVWGEIRVEPLSVRCLSVVALDVGALAGLQKAYDTVAEAAKSIGGWMGYSNRRWRCAGLDQASERGEKRYYGYNAAPVPE